MLTHPLGSPSSLPLHGATSEVAFFEWVHQFYRLSIKAAAALNEPVAPLGSDGPITQEPLRFVGNYSLTPEVCAGRLVGSRVGETWQTVQVNFIGLAGAMGILPHAYAVLITERLRKKDRALTDFLDLFFHRLMSLYYRAWIKHRLPYRQHYGQGVQAIAPTECWLKAAVGDWHRQHYGAQVYFGGYFQRQVRSVHALARMVMTLVGVPVRVEEFVGRWEAIVPEDRTALIPSRQFKRTGVQVPQLGHGLLLGRRWWNAAAGVAVHLGPMSLAEFNQWRQGTVGFKTLAKLIAHYVPLQLEVCVRFQLRPGTPIGCRLGDRPQLGRGVWLGSGQRSSVASVRVVVSKSSVY